MLFDVFCLVLLTQGINICSFTIKINKCHSHSETKLFITQTLESFEIFLIQFFSIFYDDHHVLLDLYFGQIPEVWTQVKTEYNQLSWHHTSINHEKVTSHITSNLCSIIYKHFDVYKLQHCKTIWACLFKNIFLKYETIKTFFTWTTLTTKKRDNGIVVAMRRHERTVSSWANILGPSSQTETYKILKYSLCRQWLSVAETLASQEKHCWI